MRSRMLIIELLGYNLEQKKAIANKIIQKQFAQSPVLDQNDFEIKPEALEKLINQTKEKGVRQLKSALDSIFNYYLLQLARQEKQGDKRSKIIITPNLMKQIITYNFVNVDSEGVEESLSEIQQIKREIKILQEQEKSRQVF